MLRRLRIRVMPNTDSHLLSNTSMTHEFTLCADEFGWTLDDFHWITINSVMGAFADFAEQRKTINEIAKLRSSAVCVLPT